MRERNEIWLLSTEEAQVVIFLCCCGVISANRSSFANRRWVDKTVTDRGEGKVALIGWRLEVESREGSAKEWSLCWDVVRVVSEKARSTRTQFSIFFRQHRQRTSSVHYWYNCTCSSVVPLKKYIASRIYSKTKYERGTPSCNDNHRCEDVIHSYCGYTRYRRPELARAVIISDLHYNLAEDSG